MSSVNAQTEETTQQSHTFFYILYRTTVYDNCPWLQDLTPHTFLSVFFKLCQVFFVVKKK